MSRGAFFLGASGLVGCGLVLGLGDPTRDPGIGAEAGADATSDGAGDAGPSRDTGAEASAEAGPIVLSSKINAWAIAVDDSYVYWTQAYDGYIRRASKVDGSGQIDLASSINYVGTTSIAVDSTYVYFGAPDAVHRCGINGCQNTPLQLSPIVVNLVAALDLDSTFVYWVEYGSNDLYKVDKNGGTYKVVATLPAQAYSLKIRGGFAYVGLTKSDVSRVDVATGAVSPLTQPGPALSTTSLDVANGYVYFTTYDDAGTVSFVSTGGWEAGVGALALAQALPRSVVVDSANAYWAAGDLNGVASIVRCSIATCVPTEIAGGQHGPLRLAQDDASVYWTNGGIPPAIDDGEIMRLGK